MPKKRKKKTSVKQRQANRINGKKGGTKSPEISCFNAVTHGGRGQNVLYPWESKEDFSQLMTYILADLQPEGPMEYRLVQSIVEAMWRKDRLVRFQRDTALENAYRDDLMKELLQASLYECRLERTIIRMSAQLRQLKKERQAAPRVPLPNACFLPTDWVFDSTWEKPQNHGDDGPGLPILPSREEADLNQAVQKAKAQLLREWELQPYVNQPHPSDPSQKPKRTEVEKADAYQITDREVADDLSQGKLRPKPEHVVTPPPFVQSAGKTPAEIQAQYDRMMADLQQKREGAKTLKTPENSTSKKSPNPSGDADTGDQMGSFVLFYNPPETSPPKEGDLPKKHPLSQHADP